MQDRREAPLANSPARKRGVAGVRSERGPKGRQLHNAVEKGNLCVPRLRRSFGVGGLIPRPHGQGYWLAALRAWINL
ncbi:MAG: hypothetical protein ACR2L2_09170, partial [Acidobacteriota bacterium]